jgi:hypothetical protein
MSSTSEALDDAPTATVLVSSFDGYADCWMPMCHSLRKYWPDCPFPIQLMTIQRPFAHDGIQVQRLGDDRGWASNLLAALERIKTPYVLYLQEDYWLSEAVDTARIRSYLTLMETHALNYIRLLAFPPPDGPFPGDPRLGVLATDAGYRTSVQATLWRTEVLRRLLVPGETAWRFEFEGTERSRHYGQTFLSVRSEGKDEYANGIRYLCSAVNAGKWYRLAKEYARRENLAVDFGNLPSETWWDEFKRCGWLGRQAGVWVHRIHLIATRPGEALRKAGRRLDG